MSELLGHDDEKIIVTKKAYFEILRDERKVGWNDAIEAAAELMQKQTRYPGSGDEWEHGAAAIRKLKKP